MTEWDMALTSLKSNWRFIAIGIVCGCLLAGLVTLLQKPVWQAEMVVGATERTGVPSLSSLLPQGAADAPALQLFADRIDAATSTDFTRFETVLNSPQTIQELAKNASAPFADAMRLQLWLDRHLKIRSYGLTPYRKVTIRHHDPEQAKTLLENLFTIADTIVRQDKKVKTQRRIAYLEDQLQNVRSPDHRDAIVSLIKEQEQTAMMVAIDDSFAADLIRPPYILPEPVAPRPIILFPLLAIAGGFTGLMLGGLIRAVKQ